MRYEIRLIGTFVIPGCLDCEQGRRIGEVEIEEREGERAIDARHRAKRAAIAKFPNACEDQIHPFLVKPIVTQLVCSASPIVV